MLPAIRAEWAGGWPIGTIYLCFFQVQDRFHFLSLLLMVITVADANEDEDANEYQRVRFQEHERRQ